MEILKKLLSSTFDKRIETLENRGKQNMKDLLYTSKSYIKQGKDIERLSHIKIEDRQLTKNKTTVHLKKDILTQSLKPSKSFHTINKKRQNNNDNLLSRNKTYINQKDKLNMTMPHNNQPNQLSMSLRSTNSKPRKDNDNNSTAKSNRNSIKKDSTITKLKGDNIKKVIISPLKKLMLLSSVKGNNQATQEEDNNKILQELILPDKKTHLSIDINEYIRENGKVTFIQSLSSYLDMRDKISLYSTIRCFKNNLCELIQNKKKEFQEIHQITLQSNIEDKIDYLKLKYSFGELDEKPPLFELSRGSYKAIEMLNDGTFNRIFTENKLEGSLNEIILPFRILFLLSSVSQEINIIKDDKLFWRKTSHFILENNNTKTGTYLLQLIKGFKFTDVIIVTIKQLLHDKTEILKPNYFLKICNTTSLIILALKEALEYCGIIPNDNKNVPVIMYNTLMYLKTIENHLNKYISTLSQ